MSDKPKPPPKITECPHCGTSVMWLAIPKADGTFDRRPFDAKPLRRAWVRFGEQGRHIKEVDNYVMHPRNCTGRTPGEEG